ncbi:MAG: hypothetical protein E6K76_02795 [Candidatus Eisenbacteria bacterium]|uniref:Uncharacterized protein n=1 Tax=Eiseniibacteriota bacterium TaxID=2212470 RepID=A0A538T8U7_UNCEI|nr:MAG: hypothetical protein E6K76_02795 [Candidatus Eisenbacteria bacterium]
MKRFLMLILGSAIAITVAGAAMAQSSDPASGKSDAQATDKAKETTPPSATPPPDAGTTPVTPPPASATVNERAAAKSNPAIERVKERGLKVSTKERADIDKKLDEIERQIENEATSKGDAAVAGRIAGEFSMTADALTAERNQFSRGWGEILVAHTLFANAKSDVTFADILQMRNQGMGWAVIAHGLGLRLGEVVGAVKTEGRVAMGLAKGDGKPATIHASTGANAKAGAKVNAGKTSTSAGTGIGVGVDIDKAAKGTK